MGVSETRTKSGTERHKKVANEKELEKHRSDQERVKKAQKVAGKE